MTTTTPYLRSLRRQVAELLEFVERLAAALSNLSTASDGEWSSASQRLEALLVTYRWVVAGELEEDLRRIDELVEGLSSLSEWGVDYSTESLREAVREGLQSPVSERGRRVGSGVYLGPPTGIAGADYDVVYILGMVERQFPPRLRRNPWLAQNQPELDRVAALERYDFMAAVAAAKEAVLSFPSATAERNAAYPSRWLIEAANRRHEHSGATGRLTYENLVVNADAKPWLTYIRSREANLRGLTGSSGEPADTADYNLMHLVDGGQGRPAPPSGPRIRSADDRCPGCERRPRWQRPVALGRPGGTGHSRCCRHRNQGTPRLAQRFGDLGDLPAQVLPQPGAAPLGAAGRGRGGYECIGTRGAGAPDPGALRKGAQADRC